MSGRNSPPSSFICLVNIEDRIPRARPIREVKRQIDRVLKALHSVRSERQLCERLPYDALFQWFMDINMEAGNSPSTPACSPRTQTASLQARSPRSSSRRSWDSRAQGRLDQRRALQRRRIEQIFGWTKSIGGCAKARTTNKGGGMSPSRAHCAQDAPHGAQNREKRGASLTTSREKQRKEKAILKPRCFSAT